MFHLVANFIENLSVQNLGLPVSSFASCVPMKLMLCFVCLFNVIFLLKINTLTRIYWIERSWAAAIRGQSNADTFIIGFRTNIDNRICSDRAGRSLLSAFGVGNCSGGNHCLWTYDHRRRSLRVMMCVWLPFLELSNKPFEEEFEKKCVYWLHHH